jgi:hypothetical protein
MGGFDGSDTPKAAPPAESAGARAKLSEAAHPEMPKAKKAEHKPTPRKAGYGDPGYDHADDRTKNAINTPESTSKSARPSDAVLEQQRIHRAAGGAGPQERNADSKPANAGRPLAGDRGNPSEPPTLDKRMLHRSLSDDPRVFKSRGYTTDLHQASRMVPAPDVCWVSIRMIYRICCLCLVNVQGISTPKD